MVVVVVGVVWGVQRDFDFSGSLWPIQKDEMSLATNLHPTKSVPYTMVGVSPNYRLLEEGRRDSRRFSY